jgi:phosphoserine aminotransferase
VLHTGHWTKKALEEINRVARSRLAASTEADQFLRLPRPDEIRLNPDASCVYMCSNNTIFGSQWRFFPDTGDAPLVADMSSDILSRSLDVARFGLIFAGAQKNLGPAGVTVVIIRRDLAERAPETLPGMLQYRSHIKQRSLYNTPPTFAIYLVALLMDWLANEGGLPAIERRNEEKAGLLYHAIDASGFYHCPVEEPARSRMNVVFRIGGNNEALEQKFAGDAAAAGLVGLKGHRAVGGIRASIYNAQPLAAVQALVEFMREFERENG